MASPALPATARRLGSAARWAAARPHALLLGLILLLGCLVRAYGLGHRSLWLDEAWRANLLRDFDTLWGGMKIHSTPPGFVLASFALTRVLGTSETALRLLPCLLGMASLVLTYRLARRWADRWTALVALGLLAFAPSAVHYSRQFEHYAADVFFALLLVLLAEGIQEDGRGVRWLVYSAAATISLGLSYGAVFIALVAGAVLFWRGRRERDPRWLRSWALAHVPIALAGLGLYLVFLRSQVRFSRTYLDVWAGCFPDTSGLVALGKWLVLAHLKLLDFFFSWDVLGSAGGLSLALVIIGLAEAARAGPPRFLAYALGPLALTLAASSFKVYPYGHRVMLFAAPLVFIACAAGAVRLSSALSLAGAPRLAPVLPAVLIAFPLLVTLNSTFPRPAEAEEMRPVVAKLRQHREDGDWIFVYYKASAAFDFYFREPGRNVVYEDSHREEPARYREEMDRVIEPGRRVWLVFSHAYGDEVALHLRYFRERARLLRSFEATGAAAYLFEVKDTAPAASGG